MQQSAIMKCIRFKIVKKTYLDLCSEPDYRRIQLDEGYNENAQYGPNKP